MTTDDKAGKDDMNTEETIDDESEVLKPNKKSGSPLILFLSLILSIAALLSAAYIYRQTESFKSDSSLVDRIDRVDSLLDNLGRSLSSIQLQQQQLEGGLASLVEEQLRTAASLQSLYNAQNTDEISWSLTEVEHLINIANLRLTLEKDVDTALVALQTADSRLAQLGAPGLFNIRRILASEMNALRSVTPVDITGLSLYLTDMAGRVNDLPLKAAVVSEDLNVRSPVDQNLPEWKKLLLTVWYEFKGMFSITRTVGNSSATLLPDEKYFLYQNLRLQLEAARLAVIRRDTANLHESIQEIRIWLNEYFDEQDSAVINILEVTETMSQLELDPLLPDVGSSLKALRDYMANSNSDSEQAQP